MTTRTFLQRKVIVQPVAIIAMLAIMLSTTILINMNGSIAYASPATSSRANGIVGNLARRGWVNLVICIGNSATAYWYVGGKTKDEKSSVNGYVKRFAHAVGALVNGEPRDGRDAFMLGGCLGAVLPFVYQYIGKQSPDFVIKYAKQLLAWLADRNNDDDNPPPPPAGPNGETLPLNPPGAGGAFPGSTTPPGEGLPPVEFIPINCSSSTNCTPSVTCADATTAPTIAQCSEVMCIDGTITSPTQSCSTNPFVNAAATLCSDGTIAPPPGDQCSDNGGVSAGGEMVCLDGSKVTSADQCNNPNAIAMLGISTCADGSVAMYSDQCATTNIASGNGSDSQTTPSNENTPGDSQTTPSNENTSGDNQPIG